MLVLINGRKRTVSFNGTIEQLLRKLRIRREEVLVLVNGTLAPENKELKGEERVKVIRISSGG